MKRRKGKYKYCNPRTLFNADEFKYFLKVKARVQLTPLRYLTDNEFIVVFCKGHCGWGRRKIVKKTRFSEWFVNKSYKKSLDLV
jgi:hypothetical protein